MIDRDLPQIYLVTPPAFELAAFTPRLSAVLEAHPVACLRLSMASQDEDSIGRAADALREIAHARDIPLVIDSHIGLVDRLGLDGVHLPDGPRRVRKTREALGADAIIGAYCGASRHDGIAAGEAGADYIAYGPVGESGLGDGTRAAPDLFEWWSDMIELPVVAEGALDAETVARLAPITDFLAIGEEIWRTDDAPAALGRLIAAMG